MIKQRKENKDKKHIRINNIVNIQWEVCADFSEKVNSQSKFHSGSCDGS